MKNQTTKRHTTFRKAERAKRGKRHVYQAPPAPRVKPEVAENVVVKSLADATIAQATIRAKVLMASWS